MLLNLSVSDKSEQHILLYFITYFIIYLHVDIWYFDTCVLLLSTLITFWIQYFLVIFRLRYFYFYLI